MPKDLQLKAALTGWLATQSKYASLRDMADATAMPFNTLRGYFSGKRPSKKNLDRLVEITGLELHATLQPTPEPTTAHGDTDRKSRTYAARVLDNLEQELVRCLASIPAAQNTLRQGTRRKGTSSVGEARLVQGLMDALQRNLDPFLEDPVALRVLRETVSGSDAGYLAGLLGALFDERRLQTWRQMTTYKYGSK